MENKKPLRHVAIIQNESESEVLRELNTAIDENELVVINYNKERVRTDDNPDPIWRIEIFFEGPNVFGYDFSGSQTAKLNTSEAAKSQGR